MSGSKDSVCDWQWLRPLGCRCFFPCASCANEFRNSLRGPSKLSACLFSRDGSLLNQPRRCVYRESSGFNGCFFWRTALCRCCLRAFLANGELELLAI